MSEERDWLSEAKDFADERESSLLSAIEEVERARGARVDMIGLGEAANRVLAYLAGRLAEIGRMQNHLSWLLQKREESTDVPKRSI